MRLRIDPRLSMYLGFILLPILLAEIKVHKIFFEGKKNDTRLDTLL